MRLLANKNIFHFSRLNSPHHVPAHEFEACCRQRGTIRGTSVIPPNKLRELLPPKCGSMPPAIESRPVP
jgi:hypothetical protein